MGHCDSPAQFGRHSGFFGAGRRAAGSDSPGRDASGAARGEVAGRGTSAAGWILLILRRTYKFFLSPFLGGACKYYPSCSNYAYEAIALHGARRGIVLALKRLVRCRPFTQGGHDPVPGPRKASQERLRIASQEPVR